MCGLFSDNTILGTSVLLVLGMKDEKRKPYKYEMFCDTSARPIGEHWRKDPEVP